jgi:hypothetical protein
MPWNDGLNPQSPAYGIAADLSQSVRVVWTGHGKILCVEATRCTAS